MSDGGAGSVVICSYLVARWGEPADQPDSLRSQVDRPTFYATSGFGRADSGERFLDEVALGRAVRAGEGQLARAEVTAREDVEACIRARLTERGSSAPDGPTLSPDRGRMMPEHVRRAFDRGDVAGAGG